jgi:hypothetical protein
MVNFIYLHFYTYNSSEVKVHSSEQAKEPEKEKPIGLVDSMIESVLNMIKLFQNSEFVRINANLIVFLE